MKSIAVRIAAAFVAAIAAVPSNAEVVETLPDTSRLVAIGGSLTEIIYALGEEERLIARDSTAVYPPEALELPDVGYMRAISPEGVLSIDPSAILMLEGSGPPEAIDVLQKASIPMAVVPETFDAEGILTKIETVGHAIGVEDKADQLAEETRADLAAAQALTGDVEERRRVLFVLSNQGGRLLASGTGTAADGAINMAGAINVMSDYAGYKQVTDEAVIEARPDVVLVMARGSGDHSAADDELLAHPAIAATPAGSNGAIIRMDGAYLLGFGPRTAAAIRDLASELYGEAIAN